jgi:arginyl-tRNA synthetase
MNEEKLLEKIKNRCKKQLVTVDMLLEGKSFQSSEKITNAIQKLVEDGKLYTKTCCNGGRFETRLLVTGEEIIEFAQKPRKVRKALDKPCKKTKRILSKTKRSLLR